MTSGGHPQNFDQCGNAKKYNEISRKTNMKKKQVHNIQDHGKHQKTNIQE